MDSQNSSSTVFGAEAAVVDAPAVAVGEALRLAYGGAVALLLALPLELVAVRLACLRLRHHVPRLCHSTT